MVSTDDSNNSHSGFLDLPTEIRCHIYDLLLTDSYAITISAGYTTIAGDKIQDRARKTNIPGLPLTLAPLVRCHRDTSLFSVANPPTIAIDNGCIGDATGGELEYPAPLALLQTCRLVNDELTDYMRGKKRIARARSSEGGTEVSMPGDAKQGLSLYVSYPYGVLVLKSLYPFLLKQARKVHISGYCISPKDIEPDVSSSEEASDEERLTPSSSFAESFTTPTPVRGSYLRWTRIANSSVIASTNTDRPRLRLDPPSQRQQRRASETSTVFPPFSPDTNTVAGATLVRLIRTLFPTEPSQVVELSARILYPGEDTYASVWADDDSPLTHILRNIRGGKIDMQVKRGNLGTGLCVTARHKPEGRVISTSWENWRPATPVGMRRPLNRMSVKDLDAFLVGEA
ncbi:uncharacterized protein K460DRAFT_365701 [Cucurbitaria berberidis CBS 394.84]|uniref:Uncharacterized protein n=1 Tax=Cucurbitaria berberidis CBS 394.84 TaxID=1168544 RepID=A0A9P4L7X5_9PLEO|nr:uncharacterized protein K460DRAFT_365701 [Cucurbitaria berberidis CBS 394.84]KAF1844744.1 hypothetical protein K460DRAFT_365701 [Cucurbitaria berberidis CBS 394.84]